METFVQEQGQGARCALRRDLKVAHQRHVPVVRQLYVASTNHLPHDGTCHICGDTWLATQVLHKLVGPVRRVGPLKGLPYPAFRQLVLSLAAPDPLLPIFLFLLYSRSAIFCYLFAAGVRLPAPKTWTNRLHSMHVSDTLTSTPTHQKHR